MPDERLRRSIMLTPGNRAERIAKAASLPVDGVAVDLEDGVGPDQKAEARAAMVTAFQTFDFGPRERIVRINAVGTEAFEADIQALPAGLIDTVFVPKVEDGEQSRRLDEALERAERDAGRARPLDVIATIETPRGMLKALDIADAGQRTSALFFGSGDYSAATGQMVTERALQVPRATVVAAAAAAGLQAIDAAYFTAVKDADATRADDLVARELGFDGKVIFHPNQIAPCNAVFSPEPAEVARAERIVAAHREALARGEGVAYVDGEFLAIDIVAMAERIIARARQVEARDKGGS
jgi:citrate lyase beta subunit